MSSTCEVHHNSAAKITVLSAGITAPYVENWLQEEHVILMKLKNHECYALLAKTDVDLFGTHHNPYVLHYIYTDPSERGKEYATTLLKKLKESYQVTLFPEDSTSLFEKAGYHSVSDGLIFRYPQ